MLAIQDEQYVWFVQILQTDGHVTHFELWVYVPGVHGRHYPFVS